MTREHIEKEVISFLVKRLEIEPSLIKLDADLKEDLGMSSLDLVESMIFVKRTFGFQPARGVLHHLFTINDWCDYIEANVID